MGALDEMKRGQEEVLRKNVAKIGELMFLLHELIPPGCNVEFVFPEIERVIVPGRKKSFHRIMVSKCLNNCIINSPVHPDQGNPHATNGNGA